MPQPIEFHQHQMHPLGLRAHSPNRHQPRTVPPRLPRRDRRLQRFATSLPSRSASYLKTNDIQDTKRTTLRPRTQDSMALPNSAVPSTPHSIPPARTPTSASNTSPGSTMRANAPPHARRIPATTSVTLEPTAPMIPAYVFPFPSHPYSKANANQNFFNAYYVLIDSVPDGTYCSFYTQPWSSQYATNYGQDRGSKHYYVTSSYGYSLNPQDSGRK